MADSLARRYWKSLVGSSLLDRDRQHAHAPNGRSLRSRYRASLLSLRPPNQDIHPDTRAGAPSPPATHSGRPTAVVSQPIEPGPDGTYYSPETATRRLAGPIASAIAVLAVMSLVYSSKYLLPAQGPAASPLPAVTGQPAASVTAPGPSPDRAWPAPLRAARQSSDAGHSSATDPGASSTPAHSAVSPLCLETPAPAPSGWQPIGSPQVTAGADRGSVCITQSGPSPWVGLYLPQAPGPDYTVSVRGRLAHVWGWGVAAGAAWSASNGSISGHAVQYDAYTGGYDDTIYPSTAQTVHLARIDDAWHSLTVIVRGSRYALQVDGTTIALGQLSGSGNGVFIRVWNHSAVELLTPVVTPR